MEWIENQQLADQILLRIWEEMSHGQNRANEIHGQDVHYCLTAAYLNKTYPQVPPTKTIGLFAVGLYLEQMLLRGSRQQERGEKDRITLSIDSIILDPLVANPKHTEFKTTRIRAGNFPYKDGVNRVPWGWQRQILSQMYMFDVTEIDYAVFHIIEASLQSWTVRAPWSEIEMNWQLNLERRDVLETALATHKKPEPFQWLGYEGECDNCVYRTLVCEPERFLKGQILGL